MTNKPAQALPAEPPRESECPDCKERREAVPKNVIPNQAEEMWRQFRCPNTWHEQAAVAPVPVLPRVEDHKWFDPECHEKGCQSLLYKQRMKELFTLAKKFRNKVHLFQLSDDSLLDFNEACKQLRNIGIEIGEKL